MPGMESGSEKCFLLRKRWTIISCDLELSSIKLLAVAYSLVVTEEQRYGPRWLRDNDDDDSLCVSEKIAPTLKRYSSIF